MTAEQNNQSESVSYLKRFSWFIFFFFLLFIEGIILFFLGSLTGIDSGDSSGAMAAGTAYLIVAVIFIILGAFIVFRRSNKYPIRNLNVLFFGGGMAMILFTFIAYPIWYQINNAPPSAEAIKIFEISKVLALEDNLLISPGGKPIGVHLEYAIQIPIGAPAEAAEWVPLVTGSPVQIPARNEFLDDDLYALPDSLHTMPEDISSNESGTTVVYNSYDFFPDGSIIKGRDAEGNITFCFNTNARTTSFSGVEDFSSATSSDYLSSNMKDFYSSIWPNVMDATTSLRIYLLSSATAESGITTSTNNGYDVKSFFETVAQGSPCSLFDTKGITSL